MSVNSCMILRMSLSFVLFSSPAKSRYNMSSLPWRVFSKDKMMDVGTVYKIQNSIVFNIESRFTAWEKVLANHIADRGLKSRIEDK